eukprot:82690-Rhodomonas_salina.2
MGHGGRAPDAELDATLGEVVGAVRARVHPVPDHAHPLVQHPVVKYLPPVTTISGLRSGDSASAGIAKQTNSAQVQSITYASWLYRVTTCTERVVVWLDAERTGLTSCFRRSGLNRTPCVSTAHMISQCIHRTAQGEITRAEPQSQSSISTTVRILVCNMPRGRARVPGSRAHHVPGSRMSAPDIP